MKMSMRWYGTGFDTVTLSQIRQVPDVTGVITTLYDSLPGEVWAARADSEHDRRSGMRRSLRPRH